MENNLIKKNTVLNIIKSASSIIFPVVTFSYISRILMTESVGKINFGNSIVNYFTLLASLGISTYAIKECSRNRDNKKNLSQCASEIFSINICSTLISYIILILTLLMFKKLDNYRELILIQSSAILFTTIGADWINSAMEDFKYITIRSICFQIVSLVLMFIFIHQPGDYLKYAAITVLATSGSNILNIFYRKKYCNIRFTFQMNLKKHFPPIMMFFSMIIAQQIYVNSDITILGLYRGDFEVGLYSTSVKIYTIVNTIIASVSTVVWPQIAEAYKNEKQEDVNRLSKYSLGFILTFGLPAIVGINLISEEIILLIAGPEYINATSSLHILTIALFFSFIGGWMGSTNFLPNGKEKICVLASCCSAIINIFLNLFMIPYLGLNGAAITTAISECCAFIILSIKFDRKLKINGLKEMIFKPLVGCFIISLVSIIIRIFVINKMIICVLTILLSILIYPCCLFILKDEFFMGYIDPILKKFKSH